MLELAEAEARTQPRMASLAATQERLAEAQELTEKKLAETRLNELLDCAVAMKGGLK
jgi:hypothetical protein